MESYGTTSPISWATPPGVNRAASPLGFCKRAAPTVLSLYCVQRASPVVLAGLRLFDFIARARTGDFVAA
jgi:hypothetical protein